MWYSIVIGGDMARKPYTTDGKVIRVSTGMDLRSLDHQLTIHLDNLRAHYGRDKMIAFLKELYFGKEVHRSAVRNKKVSSE
jgi:hypothetical protein